MSAKPKQVQPDLLRGHKLGESEFTFENRDVSLYSLGIGFNQDPLKEADFRFTYENDEFFSVFPTMPVVAISNGIEGIFDCPGLPEFNPMMLLHGEQKIISYKPIPVGTTCKTVSYVSDVADKVKGALLTITVSLTEGETRYADIVGKLFIRGIGGFGDKGYDNEVIPKVPEREPDFIAEEVTEKNRAVLYRLSGDINPLHIDPNMAALGGFKAPILHGLCTYGISAKAIYEKYCPGQPEEIKVMNARFTSHVFPGETLLVETYQEGKFIHFETRTKERGKVVAMGFVELRQELKL